MIGERVPPVIRFRRLIAVVVHAMLIVASAAAAAWLRFDGEIPEEYVGYFFQTIPLLVACRVALFIPFRLFQGLWRYTSIYDLRNILLAVLLSSLLYFALHLALGVPRPFPKSILMIDSILLVCLLTGVRLSHRIYRELAQSRQGRRVLVFGAGDAGELIVRDMRQNPAYGAQPVGFLDDDSSKYGRTIHGLPVLGGRAEAKAILQQVNADEVLIAVPTASPQELRAIVRALEHSKVRITTLPGLGHFLGRPVDVGQIRPLEVQDLLQRDPVELDPAPVRELLAGRRVLVTGAGGSIGSEICRQAAAFMPSRLVVLDRYENALFDLLNSLARTHPAVPLVGAIADVTDQARIEALMSEYRPDVVFHAAAHKHVPLMEANACEAVKNNVRGTRLVAEAAQRHGASRFVLISTDKAVNPTSIMGATKRVAELTTQAMAGAGGRTDFSAVRFGNVLASNGSVVPLFLDQIAAGGPVTVTHPDMQRYFMLISEAVQLVLQAATHQGGGSVYVLDMGGPVNLLDLARDLIRLSGYIPEVEIPIQFIGPRPGEKLSEELVGDDEDAAPSGVPKVRRVSSRRAAVRAGGLLQAVASLEDAAAAGRVSEVLARLHEIVPGFVSRTPASQRSA
ncbi:MAG: polysaccharide biosynthesis protein [Acidimicrobiia bacterium]|nr:polysaccharide biosynthesis protein [Acidimicrobiia bacterium]